MATIVEYSSKKKAINAYPARIVSPSFPSRCCASSSDRVGAVQDEHAWPFVYHRCTVCGFTVRRFAPLEQLLETRRTWRNSGEAIPTADAA